MKGITSNKFIIRRKTTILGDTIRLNLMGVLMFYTVINAAPQCNAKHEAIKLLIDIVSLKIILATQQVPSFIIEIENIDPISHFISYF